MTDVNTDTLSFVVFFFFFPLTKYTVQGGREGGRERERENCLSPSCDAVVTQREGGDVCA